MHINTTFSRIEQRQLALVLLQTRGQLATMVTTQAAEAEIQTFLQILTLVQDANMANDQALHESIMEDINGPHGQG